MTRSEWLRSNYRKDMDDADKQKLLIEYHRYPEPSSGDKEKGPE